MNDHVRSEDLAAYVDGRLSAESRGAVESHIAGCSECLDELAEVTALMGNREKIPAGLLEQALGGKGGAGRSVLPLRLAFEVAAAVMVVVFIGYVFIANNRFWQVPEQKKPAEAAERKDIRPAAPAVAANRETEPNATRQDRRRTAVAEAGKDVQRPESEGKMKAEADRAADEKILAEHSALKKMEIRAADKSVPASPVTAAPLPETEDMLQARLEERPGVVAANETTPQKEAAVEPAAAGAVGGAGQDFAARDQALARAKKGIAPPLLPVRIEGEARVSDLRNPELLFAWSWLPEGLALELGIDGAGHVVHVVTKGKFSPPIARQAELEARKLQFSASAKKLRRAHVVAESRTPSPAEPDKSPE